MKTPDEEVAEKILQRFKEESLLSEEGVKKLGRSLSKGELRAGDWRLIVETDRLRKEDNDADKSQ
jgi:hypothetical protein